MVSEFEAVFERTTGNAAMQVTICGRFLLLAGDGQQIGLVTDVEIVLGESRNRDRDTVLVFTRFDDVIGAPWAFLH
ncbi:hypothetical protein GCM10007920_05910 [Ciceribacter naphthalenivorans]|uniref:Uncharacterized protein n=2 Tax=Alphaproteobacteria TaxID=28211 RepID=A0A512HMT5_9HYPH|nr:hypothetical protein RNA01_36880 [Ciceribacter naphthalenivorans]GLR20807.1 hypothetical protein GCM10007920_05910 [Ciceribacter naphthalenivorans]GLT03663.1 hypothetical protein GCM10007926_05910 [Sphingomonas psychrolutea]